MLFLGQRAIRDHLTFSCQWCIIAVGGERLTGGFVNGLREALRRDLGYSVAHDVVAAGRTLLATIALGIVMNASCLPVPPANSVLSLVK